jgi:hypothetical protein
MNEDNNTLPGKVRWQGIARTYGCGRTKARMMLQVVGQATGGIRYAGNTPYVDACDLETYEREHGGISVTWPKR